VTANSAIGVGDCACEVGVGVWSRDALAGVEVTGDPDRDAAVAAPAEPHAHSKIAAIEASALMTA